MGPVWARFFLCDDRPTATTFTQESIKNMVFFKIPTQSTLGTASVKAWVFPFGPMISGSFSSRVDRSLLH